MMTCPKPLCPHGPQAYSYVRFSSPEQARGDSLRRQVEAARRWAAERGMGLDESLRDLGLSAYSGKHRSKGSLGAFLAAVEDGSVVAGSVLVVESLDRLSRERPLHALDQLRAICRQGVDVVTLSDGRRYTDAGLNTDFMELFGSLVVMQRAHEESLRKSERVAAAWSQKRRRAATGEAMTGRCVAWCRTEGAGAARRYVLEHERAEVVRDIYRMAAGGLGRRAIAKQLNREGVPTFGASAGWQDSYVAKILDNRAVLGFGQPHRTTSLGRQPDGEELAGYYPAAVSEAEWAAARAARGARIGAGGRTGEGVTNLFPGLCRCSCGATMVVMDKGPPPKGGHYYRCDGDRRGLACGNPRPSLRRDAVERAVVSAIIGTDWQALLSPPEEGGETPGKELARLRAEQETREEEIGRLLEAFGTASPVLQVVARVESLNAEGTAARARIKELEAHQRAVPAMEPGERAALARGFVEALEGAEGEARTALRLRLRDLLRQGLERLVFHGDTVGVVALDGQRILEVAVPPPEQALRGAVRRAVERVKAREGASVTKEVVGQP